MKVVFLCQGLKDCKESVGSVLLESFADQAFSKFACLSAFASLKGVTGIGDAIEQSKTHIKTFSVIVGIDLEGTSKEALEALLKLNIRATVYYTSSPIIFHPKVYVFEGDDKTRLIVGSSNITMRGLFQNVEVSLKVDFEKPDPDGEELLKQAKSYLNPFFDGTIGNLQKLTPELINQLLENELIPTEAEKKKAHEQRRESQKRKQETTKIDISKLFPPVQIQKLPEGFKIERPPRKTEPQTVTITPLSSTTKISITPEQPEIVIATPPTSIPTVHDPWAIKGKLLWKKQDLPASDVLYAQTPTTKITGGLRLTQAEWKVNNNSIDQTKYFREDIFKNLSWIPVRTTPFVEVAEVKCYVNILGQDKGLHRLVLRHKPSGEAHQHNYTTILSWGELGEEIKKINLTGKTFYLYAPSIEGAPFYIEIRDPSKSFASFFNA